MNPFTRLVGYSVLLLVGFLAIAASVQVWVRRQERALRHDAEESRRAQFLQVVAMTKHPGEAWSPGYVRDLGRALGATIELRPAMNPAPAPDANVLCFDQPVAAAGIVPTVARVTFRLPATVKQQLLHQRAIAGITVLALAPVVILSLLALTGGRRRPGDGSAPPWATTRAEMGSFEALAKTSVEQSQALAEARGGRRLAEEAAELNRQRLLESLEEKVRLGRDLHDGIIQSLYATGLNMEAARRLVPTDPAEADKRLVATRESLNRTIRDVRAYISGLAPENLQHGGFPQAMEALTTELGSGRAAQFDVKLDDDVARTLSPTQVRETLQIAREAVSNSLRHGGASLITIRLHGDDREGCLLVQDNGAGFDSAQSTRDESHGLRNIKARAAQMNATVRVESRPAEGTRVILTFPRHSTV